MTTARRLQEIREQQQARRRATRLWDAALSGRSALPIPLGLSRTKGGVQQPSIGVASERGEIATFHHPGVATIATADPYPVVDGGSPRITINARVPPSTTIEFQPYRNGVAVGSPVVMTTSGFVQFDVEVQYEPMDLATIGITDLGTGGTAGIVAVWELRAALDP